MSVLIYIDVADGHIKKASHEVLSYGAKLAQLTNDVAEAVIFGSVNEDLSSLGKYGVGKIHHVPNTELNQFDASVYTKVLAEVAQQTGAKTLIFSNNTSGKAIAP